MKNTPYESNSKITLLALVGLMSFICLLIYACNWIWSINTINYSTTQSLLKFLGAFWLTSAIFSLSLLSGLEISEKVKQWVNFNKRKIACEKISGDNFGKYFNDLYSLYTSSSSSKQEMFYLEKIVNELSSKKEICMTLISEIDRALSSKLTQMEYHEKESKNSFEQYKEKFESQKDKSDSIKFFNKT